MSPEEQYTLDLTQAGFFDDPSQRQAVHALQVLYEKLIQADLSPAAFLNGLFKRKQTIPGIYLWGGVGRGKTYLMDLFYESLGPVSRKRVHYHKFMLDIHEQLGYLPKSPDPLITIGRKIADETRVLCIDEFHVTDVTDAMLLAGLLRSLLRNHVTLVATSNIPVDNLYLNGLQRERFMEAIVLLKHCMLEIELQQGEDFRLLHLEKGNTFLVTGGKQGHVWLKSRFSDLAPSRHIHHDGLTVYERFIKTMAQADDVVWFDFNEICNTPRAAKDYLVLAREFHTVLISDIPVMKDADDGAAKRFMHLVDALYDHRVKLLATAEAEPSQLYHGRLLQDAFDRTVSRLIEMGSHDYLLQPHKP